MYKLFSLLLIVFSSLSPLKAQSNLGSEPGKFDFYVLALSWSPSFCEGARNKNGRQCAGDKPYAFVVHGLWPQFVKGYPEYCAMPAPQLDSFVVNKMLDIMPAVGLIKHEWEAHGTCSGLPASQYFENVRKARAAVKIPQEFESVSDYKSITPQEVETAFLKSNPKLTNEGIAVKCSRNNMSEIHICLNRDFSFATCPDVHRQACKRDKIIIPPMRAAQ